MNVTGEETSGRDRPGQSYIVEALVEVFQAEHDVRIDHPFDAGSHPNVPSGGDHDGATDLTGAGHRFCSIGTSSWRGHRHRNGHVNLIGKNRIQRLGQMRSRSNAILVIPHRADNAQTLRGNRLR